MPTRNLLLLLVLTALLFPAHVVCPQNAVQPAEGGVVKPKPATAPPAAKPAAEPEDERVTVEHADNFRYDANTKTYHMTGNVVFVNKDMRLYCDRADYNEDTDTAKATGHLRATDPNSVITGDLMEADFGKKLAVVTGNVQVVTQKKAKETGKAAGGKQPQPETPAAEDSKAPQPTEPAADKGKSGEPEHMEDYWKNKTVITCERLEYYYDDNVKKMIATPRVKAVQEERTVLADQAIYEDIPRLITLIGNVTLTTQKGDEMQCEKALISMDEDWVQAEKMKGTTLRKNRSSSQKPATGAKPAGETPPAPEAKPNEPAPAAGGEGAPAKAPGEAAPPAAKSEG